ncbi:MAG TPA: SbmA/BacA-like family transporter, partial [Burkholderiales bacterium]|nr:SbmA/BacA-like family transporter [Burkholderiales bacterium]
MQKARFLTAFWALAKPYWVSDKRAKGFVLLAAVVGLSLGIVWLEVQFNTWNKNFFNALEQKIQPEFVRQLWIFSVIAFVWIVGRVYQIYLQQMLQIEWRAWLNDHFLADWLKDRSYYRLQLLDRGVDNPDQRIAEDLRLFVDNTLDLALGLLSSVVTLVSFTIILWSLSGDFTIGGVAIPGFMFWVALIYTGIGSWLTYIIGRPLVKLNFNQQRFEADYRYALVRLRENSEGVALYKGEELELGNFRERFRHVIDNWWGIMRTRKQLNWFVSFFYQFSVPFPYLVAAPRYFSGAVGMGYIFQVGNSFTNVRGALMWFIDAYTQLAAWKATIDRLTTFSEALERVKSEARELGGERAEAPGPSIGIEALELALPQGKPLLAATSIQFRPGEDVLVTGPTGAGK